MIILLYMCFKFQDQLYCKDITNTKQSKTKRLTLNILIIHRSGGNDIMDSLYWSFNFNNYQLLASLEEVLHILFLPHSFKGNLSFNHEYIIFYCYNVLVGKSQKFLAQIPYILSLSHLLYFIMYICMAVEAYIIIFVLF